MKMVSKQTKSKIEKNCQCIGGCLEADNFLQKNKQKLPEGIVCQLKNKGRKV